MTGLLIACLVINIVCIFYQIVGCFVDFGKSIALALIAVILTLGTHTVNIIVIIKCLRLML